MQLGPWDKTELAQNLEAVYYFALWQLERRRCDRPVLCSSYSQGIIEQTNTYCVMSSGHSISCSPSGLELGSNTMESRTLLILVFKVKRLGLFPGIS